VLDLIDQVGPAGDFMSTEETARRCRQEIWVPRLMDRQRWVNWQAAGASTMHERVRARVRHILATHTPTPLPPGAAEQIEAVLRAAEARLHAG